MSPPSAPEDESGEFGVLPHHADFVTALDVSVVGLAPGGRDSAVLRRARRPCSPSAAAARWLSPPARRSQATISPRWRASCAAGSRPRPRRSTRPAQGPSSFGCRRSARSWAICDPRQGKGTAGRDLGADASGQRPGQVRRPARRPQRVLAGARGALARPQPRHDRRARVAGGRPDPGRRLHRPLARPAAPQRHLLERGADHGRPGPRLRARLAARAGTPAGRISHDPDRDGAPGRLRPDRLRPRRGELRLAAAEHRPLSARRAVAADRPARGAAGGPRRRPRLRRASRVRDRCWPARSASCWPARSPSASGGRRDDRLAPDGCGPVPSRPGPDHPAGGLHLGPDGRADARQPRHDPAAQRAARARPGRARTAGRRRPGPDPRDPARRPQALPAVPGHPVHLHRLGQPAVADPRDGAADRAHRDGRRPGADRVLRGALVRGEVARPGRLPGRLPPSRPGSCCR